MSSAKDSLYWVKSDASKRLAAIASRVKKPEQFFERVVKRLYLDAQKKRWISQNADSLCGGGAWKPLTAKYAARKLRQFKECPGAGRKMMIATGRLSDSILAKSSDFRSVITDRVIRLVTVVPYAKYPNEARPFTKYSDAFWANLKQYLRVWIKKGRL